MTEPVPTQPVTGASLRKPRVLFICTGNTARSQMAQVLLEHRAGDRYDVVSAGLEPGEVNPLTVRALQDAGLPTDHLHSKGVKPMIAEHFHFAITVCDRAEASCPIFPNARYRLAWPFEDPAAATGSDEERLAVFIRVRDEIDARIQDWLAERA
ncbi:arsenate reductase [Deinococcus metalli]|uniref:Arsenate reductase n=1 Tax=Deinococcus metalli TaxID=1141878 RepID=A0A7W8NT69_9DEIO|nr:arsenate reductase ArsC [Deinococcus metalli]MBB5378768.1 arsenate reductase [Deinococcus metalli]GHF60126.1 protein-tyrosine-phosphatase [Deinococcus metalli]